MGWTGEPWAYCQRCFDKVRRSAITQEWTGLRVCPKCWDPEPAHLRPAYIDPDEGAPLHDPLPPPPLNADSLLLAQSSDPLDDHILIVQDGRWIVQ